MVFDEEKMTLEEAIDFVRDICTGVSEDIECNECRSQFADLLGFLVELKDWIEDPMRMIKMHCESTDKCAECDYLERGCPNCFTTTPEDWKL